MHAYVKLEVSSFDGRIIQEVSVGEPFVLKISTDEVDHVHDMQIQGLQGHDAQKTGLSLITINGKKTAQTSYRVTVEKPGTYTFGPVALPSGQTDSGTVALKVSAQRQEHVPTKKDSQNLHNVRVSLSIDNDTAYVGQKIKTALRVYFPQEDEITIDQIVSNDPTTVQTTKKVGPAISSETINDKEYTVYEWKWHMYPNQSGHIVVPAYFVDYAKALPVQQAFGSLAMFFGPRYERKRVYSNALSINVQALPEPAVPGGAVGSFVSFSADVRPVVARKYEGAVLTLILEGDGNMESIREPELVGLPDSLKYYFSKSMINQSSFGEQKRFEYIVQGMQEGEWEIPSQTFTFFDPKNHRYETLHTAPLILQVLPEQATAPAPSSNTLENAQVPQSEPDAPLMRMFNQDTYSMRAIPWGWFIFLCCAPLFGALAARLFSHTSLRDYYSKRCAFKYAQKDLARAYRNHDVRSIYPIFEQLFKRRCHDGTYSIDDVVKKSNLPEAQKSAWQAFYQKIAQAAYADTSEVKEVVRLFHEATQWIKDLQGVI